jgi:hypothetical protein
MLHSHGLYGQSVESPCIKMVRQLFRVTSHLDGSVSEVRLEILEIEVWDSFPTYTIDGFWGRAIAQAVSPWLPTAAARVQTRI